MPDKLGLALRQPDSIDALLERQAQRFDSVKMRLDSIETRLRSQGDLLTRLIASVGVANEKSARFKPTWH